MRGMGRGRPCKLLRLWALCGFLGYMAVFTCRSWQVPLFLTLYPGWHTLTLDPAPTTASPPLAPTLSPRFNCTALLTGALVVMAGPQPSLSVPGGPCTLYTLESQMLQGNVTNIFNHDVPKRHVAGDVTLVTHLSTDRLDRLELLSKYWPGPISAAVYTDVGNLVKAVESVCRYSHLALRRNLHIHLMQQKGRLYPVNRIRNLALQNVYTEFAFLSDVDFMPNKRMYQSIKTHIRAMSSNQTFTFVVPAFGIKRCKFSGENEKIACDDKMYDFPQSKQGVLHLLDRDVIEPVHKTEFIHGHYQTNYSLWTTTSSMYQATWAMHYEPYLVVRSTSTPVYSTAFMERYYDKVSHTLQLYVMRYKFWVLPDVFMLHIPHPTTAKKKQYWRCSLNVYKKFVSNLEKQYGKAALEFR